MATLYDVCFAGEILEGQGLSAVRTNLASLFKADEATLNRLFSGKTQLIKRGCDRKTAQRYKSAMEQAGAKAIVRTNPESVKTVPPDLNRPDEKPSAGGIGGDIELAPPQSDVLRPEERSPPVSVEIDTSGIEVMEPGVDLSDGGEEPPPAPDTSHLSMGELGADIPTPASTVELLSPDISGIALSPENTDFSDCAPPPVASPEFDFSGLVLAPGGTDLLDAAYRQQQDFPVPPTDHLELEDAVSSAGD